MKKALLIRKSESSQGTFGTLQVSEDGALLYTCFTGELPNRGNAPQVSCIPVGTYTCAPWHSKKYPNHYTVTKVPGRSAILIHHGNFCGDTREGYLSNVQGCILVGRALGSISGQKAVLSSKLAMSDLRNAIGEESFSLEIRCDYGN